MFLSGFFWSIWRRLFGEGKFKEVVSRTVQEIFGILFLAFQIIPSITWTHGILSLLTSIWVIIQYWSRSVGEIIDAGLNHHQDKNSYSRWFRIPLDWIYDKLGKEKYVGFYDFWYSLLRCSIGALPLCFYSLWALVLMPIMYPIYLFCNKLYIKHPSLCSNKTLEKLTLNEPKNLAEVIHGFIFGLVVALI